MKSKLGKASILALLTVLLVLATGIVVHASPAARPPAQSGFYYTVRWGDTLYSIARRFGTTVAAIAQANGIVNPTYIRVGQVLFIPTWPAWPPPPPAGFYYTVRPGDTLYSIARRFGTTHWAIAAANHLPNPNCIYAGQRLFIPGYVPPPPVPPAAPTAAHAYAHSPGSRLPRRGEHNLSHRERQTRWVGDHFHQGHGRH